MCDYYQYSRKVRKPGEIQVQSERKNINKLKKRKIKLKSSKYCYLSF